MAQTVAPSVAQTPEAISGFPRLAKAHTAAATGQGAMFNGYYANMVYVGSTGNLPVVLEDDTILNFASIAAGEWHPMPPFKRVHTVPGGTAGSIVVGRAFK